MTVDAAVVVAAIGALSTGLGWVARRIYLDLRKDLEDMTKDRDYWRDIAHRSMGHTDKLVERKTDGA